MSRTLRTYTVTEEDAAVVIHIEVDSAGKPSVEVKRALISLDANRNELSRRIMPDSIKRSAEKLPPESLDAILRLLVQTDSW